MKTVSGVAVSLQELIALRDAAHGFAASRPMGTASTAGTPLRRGHGMEFAEARPYLPGDDARTIDWRQTARRGKLWTKLFQEEHERPLLLLADLGARMRFGTRVAFKSVIAARAAAMLAWAAVKSGQRVGGVVCNGAAHTAIPPQVRDQGALQLLQHVAATSSAGGDSAPGLPLQALMPMLQPACSAVLISDFSTLDAAMEHAISSLAIRAEVSLLQVYDVFETDAAPAGCYQVTDGARAMTLDLRSASARTAYGAAFAARRAALERLARRLGAQLLPLATHDDPAALLRAAMGGRAR